MSFDFTYKIGVFGDTGVGKTTLIHRFITDKFELDLGRSMGVNVSAKTINIEGFAINLQIWDFVGEQRFKQLLPIYSRGTFGGIFMYDISNKISLLNLIEWISLFHNAPGDLNKESPILIVGGKLDLDSDRKVYLEDVSNLSNSYEIIDFIECSAKTGENVEKVFLTLVHEIIMRSTYL
ncbi:MAG: Rab family GTPase [Promethearchaeota archaeon]